MIKFRVRDPGTKSYIFNGITIDEALRTEKSFLPQDVIYERYSDIKDKNGVIVCEGDVISRKWLRVYPRGDGDFAEKWFDDIKFIYWREDGLFIYPHGADDEPIIEIIGNVNKDPEKWLAQPGK